jgi:NAD(P)-dependent dehydrogenase (short-subunit alcohol dehydrogenase family)
MRILVIGSTGTIGSAIASTLAPEHDVLRASRHGPLAVDIENPASVHALFEHMGPLDAVVSAAGSIAFGPLVELRDDDFAFSLRSKLMGQVNVVRAAVPHLRDGGSITLTTGVLSREPVPGSAAAALVSAGLEGFVRAAALELPRGIRINAISPPWVRETLAAMGRDPSPGMRAADVARAYVAAIEGRRSGITVAL